MDHNSPITHFDATERRRNRLRQQAQAPGTPEPVAEPTPAPVAQIQPAPVSNNGHAPAPIAMPTPVAAPVAQPAPQVQPAMQAQAAPIAQAAPAANSSLDVAELEKFLVEFVVEQTGYPEEMVEMDADLEADLGIDSIKKAQLFGEIAEHLDLKVTITEDMSLDDFPTLRHVKEFLTSQSTESAPAAATAPTPAAQIQPAVPVSNNGHATAPQAALAPVAQTASAPQVQAAPQAPIAMPTPVTAPAPVAQAAPAPQVQPAPVAAPVAQAQPAPAANGTLDIAELEKFLVEFVVEQTGYPEEMVEMDADLEADLGIDSIKKAQLFGEIAEHLDLKVTITEDMSLDDFPTLRHVKEFLTHQTA